MEAKSLYGIFGGTFDPIHNGHLQMVSFVLKSCALKQILFIPSARPPHRGNLGANAKQRLDMAALAIAEFPQFVLDDRELNRDKPSYTFDTVESLQMEYPHRNFCLILGIDAMLHLDTWYRWDELVDSLHFVVMNRPGFNTPDPLPSWWQDRFVHSVEELKKSDAGKILTIQVEPNTVSATEIRYGISENIDVSTMMTGSVWNYINEHNLYGI